ncbi:MAG TPA: M12 family metallo-peptidase [Pyrinomonadaceae bacterium]|nr:M12 family metallo-peptidase [Pyrinomonadaceae bacterium]
MKLITGKILKFPGVGAALCLVLSIFVQTQAQSPVLYRDTNRRGTATAKADEPALIRSKYIILDIRQLRNEQRRRISMPVFGRRSIVLVRSSLDRQDGSLIWKGTVADQQDSSATFVIVGDVVIGDIFTRSRNMYQIRYVGNGVHSLREVDRTKFRREADSIPPPDQQRQQRELLAAAAAPVTCNTDPATEIDVLVLFTGTTRATAGGTAAMQATILLAMQQTNDSYSNSGINQRLRLAHMEEVNYTETGNSRTDVNRLQNPTDGFMDNAHTLRNAFGADLVMLLVEKLVECGEAFNMMTTVSNAFEKSAFAVVARDCATSRFSFGHELGHLMGARHDWDADSANNSPFAFNHAFVRTNPSDSNTDPWRTIMGVNGTPETMRIPFWSNPDINFAGDPTGVATGSRQANNARTLNETAATVANFRCSLPEKGKLWTSVGSDGKVDEKDTGRVFFDRSIAQMGQLTTTTNTATQKRALIPQQTQSAVIRYNVTPADTLFRVSGGIELKLQYLAAAGSAKVVANLIEVDLASGVETTRATFNSSSFPTSNNYQVRSVAQCGTDVDRPFDFERNAYYIEVTLTNRLVVGSAAGIRMIKLSKTDCE